MNTQLLMDAVAQRYLTGTGSLRVPSGSTTQRPNVPEPGIRINEETGTIEFWLDGSWVGVDVNGNTYTWTDYLFIATAGQTVFTGLDENSISMKYEPDNVVIFLNGYYLDARDFTASDGTTVTLTSPVNEGDELIVQARHGITVSNPKSIIRTYEFVSNDGQDTFTGTDKNGDVLRYDVDNILVSVDGLLLPPSSYTATDGTSIVLEESLSLNQEVFVYTVSSFSSTDAMTFDEVNDLFNTVPTGAEIGTVAFFSSETGPLGWLPLNGSAVLRSSYEDLDDFVYVGDVDNATAPAFYHCTDNSDPDGSRDPDGDYLYLPDTRGNALRALDGGRGVDVGRVLGSEQLDQLQGHRFNIETTVGTDEILVSGQATGPISNGNGAGFGTTASDREAVQTTDPISDGVNGTPRVGDETRMRNTAFPLFIKAFYPVPVTIPVPTGVNVNGDLMIGELRGPDAVSDDGYVTLDQVNTLIGPTTSNHLVDLSTGSTSYDIMFGRPVTEVKITAYDLYDMNFSGPWLMRLLLDDESVLDDNYVSAYSSITGTGSETTLGSTEELFLARRIASFDPHQFDGVLEKSAFNSNWNFRANGQNFSNNATGMEYVRSVSSVWNLPQDVIGVRIFTTGTNGWNGSYELTAKG